MAARVRDSAGRDAATVEIAYALVSSFVMAAIIGLAATGLASVVGWHGLDHVGPALLLAFAIGRTIWITVRFDIRRRATAQPGVHH